MEKSIHAFVSFSTHFLAHFDFVFPSEILTFWHRDAMLPWDVHFVSWNTDDYFRWSVFFELVYPTLRLFDWLRWVDIVNYQSGIGVS